MARLDDSIIMALVLIGAGAFLVCVAHFLRWIYIRFFNPGNFVLYSSRKVESKEKATREE